MSQPTLPIATLSDQLVRYHDEMLDYALLLSFQNWAEAEDARERAERLYQLMLRTLLA